MNILPPPPPPPYPPPTSIHKLQQRKLPHHTLSEDEDLFAGTSFASEQESIAESLAGCKVSPSNDSYPTFASVEAQFLTKNEIICQGCSAKDEDSNGTHGKENHSPKSESWQSVEKLKPLPAGEVRGIASTVHMWKTKRKQHRERKSPSGRKSKTTHADNDTTPDMSKNNRKSPTSNFFMQMGDDEVGNHPNSDVHTQVTEPTLSNSSSTKTNSSSMQGKGIIIFQPHASAGEDFDYYLTPIRGTSCKTKTNVTIDKKSESPQSVMERIGSSVSSMHGGAGSSASSKNAALTSFPRYAKESVKLHRRRSKPQFNSGKLNRHDSSCDNSDNNGDIDDASVGTGISIAKTITDSLPPALMKLHDLIIGTSCWDVSRSRCVEGARDHVAQECNDEEGEERSNGSIGHSYSSNDDDDDASFYSSCDSSRSGNNRGGSKKEATLQTTKKSGGGQKQEHRTGRRSFLRRRGRSPTIKEGFNSDGESLRSRSRGSRASRGSRGSFSLSVDSSLGDDIEASPSCGKDIGVSVTSTYRTSPMVPLEEPIELRDSAGCVVGGGGGGGSETSTSSSANADFENTRYGSDPSGVVKHASGFAAAKGSAVDGSNSCTDSNDSVVCATSIITAENVLSFDQAMWRSMTQEKPPLTGRVDKRDEDNPRIAGSENSESSAQERYCVNASMEATTIEGYFKVSVKKFCGAIRFVVKRSHTALCSLFVLRFRKYSPWA